jgi:hypothetical protein
MKWANSFPLRANSTTPLDEPIQRCTPHKPTHSRTLLFGIEPIQITAWITPMPLAFHEKLSRTVQKMRYALAVKTRRVNIVIGACRNAQRSYMHDVKITSTSHWLCQWYANAPWKKMDRNVTSVCICDAIVWFLQIVSDEICKKNPATSLNLPSVGCMNPSNLEKGERSA